MQQEEETVLVVIPNYNGGDPVIKCIESLLSQTHTQLKLVVVDNNSTDGSYEKIKASFPQISIIQSGYNAGWGIACNIGIKSHPSRYIALINNDAYLDPKCIAEMVKAINLKAEYGSCASRILLWDDPNRIEVCGLVIYRDGSSCGRGRLLPADTYMQTEEVFCANDCCCLYRREMIEDIGDYDPDFFIYCDETDMGWKHQLAGWKCVYTPTAIAYHAHSRAAGSYSDFKAFHVERNRLYICFKYLPLPDLLLSFYFSCFRYAHQFYSALILKKGALAHYQKTHSTFSGLKVLLRAHLAAFKMLPVMWRRRSELKNKKRITNKQLRQLFRQFGISTTDMAQYE